MVAPTLLLICNVKDLLIAGSLRGIDGQLDSALNAFSLGFRPTYLNGDLHRIFHWIFERHLDSKQSVLVGRFGFVRLHRPTQSQCRNVLDVPCWRQQIDAIFQDLYIDGLRWRSWDGE